MRTLEFNETNGEYYTVIYEGFAATEKPIRGADVRLSGRVFMKLEEVGKQDEKTPLYKYDKPCKIVLEEVEYNFLKSCLQEVSWNAFGSRRAAPVLDWLDSIPDEGLRKVT